MSWPEARVVGDAAVPPTCIPFLQSPESVTGPGFRGLVSGSGSGAPAEAEAGTAAT